MLFDAKGFANNPSDETVYTKCLCDFFFDICFYLLRTDANQTTTNKTQEDNHTSNFSLMYIYLSYPHDLLVILYFVCVCVCECYDYANIFSLVAWTPSIRHNAKNTIFFIVGFLYKMFILPFCIAIFFLCTLEMYHSTRWQVDRLISQVNMDDLRNNLLFTFNGFFFIMFLPIFITHHSISFTTTLCPFYTPGVEKKDTIQI